MTCKRLFPFEAIPGRNFFSPIWNGSGGPPYMPWGRLPQIAPLPSSYVISKRLMLLWVTRIEHRHVQNYFWGLHVEEHIGCFQMLGGVERGTIAPWLLSIQWGSFPAFHDSRHSTMRHCFSCQLCLTRRSCPRLRYIPYSGPCLFPLVPVTGWLNNFQGILQLFNIFAY